MIEPIGKYAPKIKFLRNLREIKIMMKKEIEKSDFIDGMVVKLRDGSKRITIWTGTNMVLSGIDTFSYISGLDDSLKSKITPEHDIMKVYKVSSGADLHTLLEDNEDHGLTLIWERSEVVEVTMQEVADKLGIPVENLRIKE